MSAKSLVDQISMFVRKMAFFVLFATEKFIVLCSHWRDYFWCQNSKCRKQIDTFIFSWKIDIILFEGIFWRFPISFNEFQRHKGKLLCSINLQTKYFLASISSSYTSVGSSPNITNFELDRQTKLLTQLNPYSATKTEFSNLFEQNTTSK